jgi:hypothetical protein
MTSQHAPIAPSGLTLTVHCPASVGLQASVIPLPPTDEELEGTAAHWIAMQYAAGYAVNWPVGSKFKSGGREWEVDIDMVVGATMYANACGGVHPHLRLEDAVRISRIHPEHCYGTPDAWRYFTDAREALTAVFNGSAWEVPRDFPLDRFNEGKLKLVRVVDFKYGHRYVEVFGNYQLVGYASGVMERLELTDNDPDLWLELVLVQPRCYHRDGPVRRWIIPAHELRAYLNRAASAAREALGEGNTLLDGKPRAITNEHCIDCKARHVCKTLLYGTSAVVQFSTAPEVVELPPEAMGQELAILDDAIELLKARRTGVAARAEAYIRAGTPVAYYHLEPGESRMVYKDDVDVDEFVGFGDLVGVDVRKKQTKKDMLVTPTQAIQLGIDEGAMKSYAHRPPAALKLARDKLITARKVFSK